MINKIYPISLTFFVIFFIIVGLVILIVSEIRQDGMMAIGECVEELNRYDMTPKQAWFVYSEECALSVTNN